MEDFFMDIHSSCSQSYVTLSCGRIIPASHQSEISTFIVVVGIDPALWTEVLTKFNWKSWGIWRPQACLFNASLLWVGKSTMYSISHNWCLGGQCSIMWFDKQQLCYNILYVCWLHVQNGWLHTFSKAYPSQSFSFPMLKATLPRSIVVWTSLTSSCPDSSSEYPECNPLKPLGLKGVGQGESGGERLQTPGQGRSWALGPSPCNHALPFQ